MMMRSIADKSTDSLFSYLGLSRSSNGELQIGQVSLVHLANKFGTPLQVINSNRLLQTAKDFRNTFQKYYEGKINVHYAFKCNSIQEVVKLIHASSLKAEVMSEFEMELALQSGFKGNDIIVNGPFKPDSLLMKCLQNEIRLINIDSISELERLNRICKSENRNASILIRVNPNYIPKGMNQGSATASRKGSPFGLDLESGEVMGALRSLMDLKHIDFQGLHIHIGTGIRRSADYKNAILKLADLIEFINRIGLKVRILDVGGGIASATTKEMTTKEMLLYQGWGIQPKAPNFSSSESIDEFSKVISSAIKSLFSHEDLPELIIEPGRSISSSNMLLLLRIHQVKSRRGAKKWLITDGGIGTVTMPTYYEFHEVLLCNDVTRKKDEKVTISGPGCFAADIVYKNIKMPQSYPGEVIAILDSGAYFTSWESCFGFPRPAVVSVTEDSYMLVRRRESFDDMISRELNNF